MIDREQEYIKMAKVEVDHWWYKNLHLLTIKNIEKNFKNKNIKILDAGCGTGGMLMFLKKSGYHNIKGFDLSAAAVISCKNKGLDVIKGNLVNIQQLYVNEKFDIVISNDNFYHITKLAQQSYLNDVFKLLSNKGLLLMNMPALKLFSGIHDISVGVRERVSKKHMDKVFKNINFDIQYLYWPFLLSPIIYTSRLFQRIKIKRNNNFKIESDIDMPSRFINKLLFHLIRLENNFLFYKPFASSLFVIAKKK